MILKHLLQYIKSMKLKHFMLLASVALALLAMIIYFIFTYHMTLKIAYTKVDELNKKVIEQTGMYLSSEMFELEGYIKNITTSKQLIDNICKLEEMPRNDVQWSTLYQMTLKDFINTRHLHDKIHNAYIVTPNNTINNSTANSNYKYDACIPYDEIANSKIANIIEKSPYKISLFTDDEIAIDSGKYNFIGQIELENSQKAYFVLTLNSDWMQDLAGDNNKNIAVVQYDRNHIIYGINPKLNEMFESIDVDDPKITESYYDDIEYTDGKKYNITATKLAYRDFYLLLLRSDTETFLPIVKIKLFAILIAVISVLLTFPLSTLITTRIYNPLSGLTKAAGEYQQNGDKFLKLENKNSLYSFKETITTYLIIIVTVPLMLYHVSFFFISSSIIGNIVTNSLNTTVSNTVGNIDLFIKRNTRISQNIIFDKAVQTYLTSEDREHLDVQGVKNIISDNIEIIGNVKNLKIYDKYGNFIIGTSSDNSKMNQSNFEKLLETNGEIITFSEKDEYTKEITISVARKINSIYNNLSPGEKPNIGYITITYDEAVLTNIYDNLKIKDCTMYLLDADNNVISASDKDKVISPILLSKENKSRIIYSQPCNIAKWEYYLTIPRDYVGQDVTNLFYMGLAIVFLIFSATLILSRTISNVFQKPIIDLLKNINGTKEDDKLFFVNELNELTHSFNNMLQRVEKTVELEKENSKVELIALRSQVNPHFLYNAFEQIKWMSDAGEKENVETMINNLTKIFRIGINEKKIFISVDEEIEYTKAYLRIQLLRYDNSFKINWHIEDNIRGYFVPKLILQPLVENSIYHGIRELDEANGILSIYGFEQDGKLVFKVCDTGPGFTKEKCEEITAYLKEKEQSTRSIGLFNVNRRLILYFHDDYKIEIKSQPYVNTEVIIEFPITYE